MSIGHLAVGLVVERGAPCAGLGAPFALGVALYAEATAPRDRAATAAPWTLLALAVAVHAAILLGPRPPSPRAVAVAGLGALPWAPWAAWADGRRAPRRGLAAAAG